MNKKFKAEADVTVLLENDYEKIEEEIHVKCNGDPDRSI